MSNNKITLYYFPESTCSKKVQLVLTAKNISYKKVVIDLSSGAQKSPSFLAINPLGKVPVLAVDNNIICDSAIINEFLNDEFPVISLLPEKAVERAKVRFATYYADNIFYPLVSILLAEYRKPANQQNDILVKKIINEIKIIHLPKFDKELENSNSFYFHNLTLADIALAPALHAYLKATKSNLDEFESIKKWFENICNLPPFKNFF